MESLRKVRVSGGALPLAVVVISLIRPAEAEWRPRPAEPGESVYVYVSNGDNELLYTSPPVESEAAIDDYLDIICRVYHAKRLYWRGAQIEQIVNRSVQRPESRSHGEWLQWMGYLKNEVKTTQYAVEAAHARGLEVWGVAALLDHGGAAHVGTGKGYGPMAVELRERVEHPEWVPIDRYGIRRMSGPLCLAYPAARRALVELFTEIATASGYDGILFHTYAEQFHARFDDEFGFNEPIVKAYEKRFGVNVFANDQPYDVHAMAHLRGEYLTALVRELRTSLRQHDIGLGLMLDSVTPHYPQRWGLYDMRVTGRIIVDWPRYVDEQLVDQLWINYNGPQHETVNRVLAHVEQAETPCEVIMMHSDAYPPQYQHFRTRGVSRVMPGSYDHYHWGYLGPQPVTAMDGTDFIAKLSVLHQMRTDQTPFDLHRAIDLIDDPHVYVRRMAVDLLGEKGADSAEARAAVETCLNDPENCVRTYAARALIRLGAPGGIDRVYGMLADNGTYMLKNVALPWNLQTLPVDRTPDLTRGLRSPHEVVRAAVLEACRSGPLRPDVVPVTVGLAADRSFDIRWRATRVLGRFPASEPARSALLKLLDDPHPVVRSMAALQLGGMSRTNTQWVGLDHLRLVEKVSVMFGTYGDQCRADDASWGWRSIGEALLMLGPRGRKTLERFLAQDADRTLAERAWDVLFVKLSAYKFLKITAADAQKDYPEHPRFRTVPPALPAPIPEAVMMPYMTRAFEGETAADGDDERFRDARHHTGRWYTFAKDHPKARVRTAERDGEDNSYARLIRGQGLLECTRSDYALTRYRAQVQVDVLRESADSDIGIFLTGTADRWKGSTLQVRIDAKGVLQTMDARRRWHATATTLPAGEWATLELLVDLDARTYEAVLTSEAGALSRTDPIAFACEPPLNALIFYPNGNEGSRTGIDNVMVTATNPAHPSFGDDSALDAP